MIDEILLTHGGRTARATLFLHGFTASPHQFSALAAHVHAMGENVYVPRLPRHGHTDRLTETLRDLKAGELLAHAQESLAFAARLGENVRVVGFSLGGLLAAWIGQQYEVERVVAIAPLLGIAGVPVGLTGAFTSALLLLPNAFVWWDPVRRANHIPLHGYPRFPTHALAQSLLIAEEVMQRASCGMARSPIVLVTNADESSVNNRAIAKLAMIWKADDAPCVELRQITGLGWSHDIIEPLGPCATVEKSYPVLHTLLERTER